MSYNNTQKTPSGIEGGGKFWQDGDVVVTDNYIHDNIDSPGLWMDTDNAGFLVQGNYISGNGGEGLMYEISYNADIVDNTFVDNAIAAGAANKGSRRAPFTSASRAATRRCPRPTRAS